MLQHYLLGKLLQSGIKSFSPHLHSFLGDLHTWMIVLQNFVQVRIPTVAAATWNLDDQHFQ